jgi:hypothetical protein
MDRRDEQEGLDGLDIGGLGAHSGFSVDGQEVHIRVESEQITRQFSVLCSLECSSSSNSPSEDPTKGFRRDPKEPEH